MITLSSYLEKNGGKSPESNWTAIAKPFLPKVQEHRCPCFSKRVEDSSQQAIDMKKMPESNWYKRPDRKSVV